MLRRSTMTRVGTLSVGFKGRWPSQWFADSPALPWARNAAAGVLFTAAGLGLLGAIWFLASIAAGRDLPNPIATLGVLALVSNPFYDNGPNDKGVGIQLVSSVGRVFAGFALASLLAIPVGFLMGANDTAGGCSTRSSRSCGRFRRLPGSPSGWRSSSRLQPPRSSSSS